MQYASESGVLYGAFLRRQIRVIPDKTVEIEEGLRLHRLKHFLFFIALYFALTFRLNFDKFFNTHPFVLTPKEVMKRTKQVFDPSDPPENVIREEEEIKKTALCAILVVSLFGLASAQTGAGAIWIGGTAGFSSSGGDLYEYGDEGRRTWIGLSPVVDYFVAPNLFIGPALSLSRSTQGDYSNTSFDIGAAVGYALGSGGGSMIPFLKGVFQFSSSTTKDTYNDQETESKSSGTSISVGGGLLFPVAKHAGITVEAKYYMDSWKPEGADKSTSGNIIAIEVGVLGMLY